MSNKYRNEYLRTVTTPATAIAFSVECGFTPKHIVIQNATSLSKMEWFEGMAQDSALITTAGTGVVTLVTSSGISTGDVYPATIPVATDIVGAVGSASTISKRRGFTVGLNTTVNILSEKLIMFAE
jgi:hypothetical protein